MPRIMAIDYGAKRTGLAVTDPLQIIATALKTVNTSELLDFLRKYVPQEQVVDFVVGQPFRLDGRPSDIEAEIKVFIGKLSELFPNIPVHRVDETFTSKISAQSLIASGVKKKDRQNKALLDSVSATLILQDYLAQR